MISSRELSFVGAEGRRSNMTTICKSGVTLGFECGYSTPQRTRLHSYQQRKYGSSQLVRMPNWRQSRRLMEGPVSALPRDCKSGWPSLQPKIRGRILVSLVPFAWGSWTPVARGVASFPAPPPPLTFLVGKGIIHLDLFFPPFG